MRSLIPVLLAEACSMVRRMSTRSVFNVKCKERPDVAKQRMRDQAKRNGEKGKNEQ